MSIYLASFDMVDDVSFYGVVHVENIQEEKEVFARVTIDKWKTWLDIPASIKQRRSKERDFFHFMFRRSDIRFNYVEFALCCRYCGKDMWDNNNGKNYVFDNLPMKMPVSSRDVQSKTMPDMDGGTSDHSSTSLSERFSKCCSHPEASLENEWHNEENIELFFDILDESIGEISCKRTTDSTPQLDRC